MSRPRKYDAAQLRAMRRIWNREANRRRRERHRKAKGISVDQLEPRPPAEVIMERDYRLGIAGAPPPEYASRYAQTAAKLQARFAILERL